MKSKKTVLYQFDNFTVDTYQKRVTRGDEDIALTPKAFETLLVLLRNHGQLVRKDDLLTEVWADTFVEEATLAQNISTLRKSLGIAADGKQYIETVPRHGYKFTVPVERLESEEDYFVVSNRVRTIINTESEDSEKKAVYRTSKRFRFSNKKSLLIFISSLLTIVLVIGFFGYYLTKYGNNLFQTKFRKIHYKKLTTEGNLLLTAMSPDGTYIAIVLQRDRGQTLILRQTDDTNSIELTSVEKAQFTGLKFSADNRFIYYTINETTDSGEQIGNLYRISMFGGVPQYVLGKVGSSITISPDNKNFAFVRQNQTGDESAIVTADFVSGTEKVLSVRSWRERFVTDGPAWSPDGKTIACAALGTADSQKGMEIIITKVSDGKQNSLTPEKWAWIGQMQWLNDGSSLIFPAFKSQSESLTDEIWMVSFPEGKTRQVTDGINGYFGLGISQNSNLLITVKSERSTVFWNIQKGEDSAAVNIKSGITENSLYPLGIDTLPDGRVVYSSANNGNVDLWIMNSDGSNNLQLTYDQSADFMPSVSPDGSFIAFSSTRGGTPDIWKISSDGKMPKQITFGQKAFSPSISPDENWIYYSAKDEKTAQSYLWRIPVNGGSPERLTEKPTWLPQISPDGKKVVCYYPFQTEQQKTSQGMVITLLSAEDGGILGQFPDIQANPELPVLWTSDGRGILYAVKNQTTSNVWRLDLETNERKQTTNFVNEEVFRFTPVGEGDNLVVEKGRLINDLVLIGDSNN